MKNVTVIVLFVALVGGLFVAAMTRPSEAESRSATDASASATAKNGPAESTEASDVLDAVALQAMDIEELKRERGGEPVAVRGVARYVGPDMFGLPAVELSDAANGPTLVLCVLPYGDFKKLEDVRKGEVATFSGDPRGKTREGVVVMKQCVRVASPSAPVSTEE